MGGDVGTSEALITDWLKDLLSKGESDSLRRPHNRLVPGLIGKTSQQFSPLLLQWKNLEVQTFFVFVDDRICRNLTGILNESKEKVSEQSQSLLTCSFAT